MVESGDAIRHETWGTGFALRTSCVCGKSSCESGIAWGRWFRVEDKRRDARRSSHVGHRSLILTQEKRALPRRSARIHHRCLFPICVIWIFEDILMVSEPGPKPRGTPDHPYHSHSIQRSPSPLTESFSCPARIRFHVSVSPCGLR